MLKAINKDPWVEDLFTNAFNALGPVLMMAVHVLVVNCLMHNPDAFPQQTVRAAASEKFQTEPTFKNMMRYLIESILLRQRTVKRSWNVWDSACYLEPDEEGTQQADPSRSCRSLAHPEPTVAWGQWLYLAHAYWNKVCSFASAILSVCCVFSENTSWCQTWDGAHETAWSSDIVYHDE